MGKTRVIAETGAGQHGVATATACALLGLECVVYMGEVDTERQALNVARMRLLGRRRDRGEDRLPHAQGRDQRGAARLGHQRRRDALPARHGRRAAPVPDDGARLPPRHRAGGARAGARPHRAACPTRSSRASAAARTRSASSTPSSTTPTCGWSASRPGGDGVETGRHGATLTEGTPGALHGAHDATCCRTRTGRPPSRTRSPPGSTTRASGRSTPCSRTSAGPSTGRSPTPRRWTRSRCSAAPRASSRPSSRRTRIAGALKLGRELGPGAHRSWSTCPGAGTRTSTRRPRGSG